MQSVVIQCKSCGLRFVNHAAKRHIAAKRKYCDDCLSARRRINAAGTKKESIRECKECGERFFGHTSAAYCSDRCSRSAKRRAAAKYREHGPDESPRSCAWCGKTFEPTYSRSLYCSIYCRNRAMRDRLSGGIDPYFLRRGNPSKGRNASSICGAHYIGD